MDRSGKVAGAYRRLEVLKQARQLEIVAPELPTGPFQVIVADPPWRYESRADLPYPTMAIENIKALPVAAIAADDALLWLWTTTAHLRVAFDVVHAWGFEYKTLLTWVKDRMGTGEWLRGQTEHCLLAARGKPVFVHGTHTTVLQAARRGASIPESPKNSLRWSRRHALVRKSSYSRGSYETNGSSSAIRQTDSGPRYDGIYIFIHICGVYAGLPRGNQYYELA